MKVVIDTNVLVSALYSRNGAPARVFSLVLAGEITPCFDYRIMEEYRDVLCRAKFGFPKQAVENLLKWFEAYGVSLLAKPMDARFTDESDKKFYEVAKTSGALLITGNSRHFPADGIVVSVNEFLGEALGHIY